MRIALVPELENVSDASCGIEHELLCAGFVLAWNSASIVDLNVRTIINHGHVRRLERYAAATVCDRRDAEWRARVGSVRNIDHRLVVVELESAGLDQRVWTGTSAEA